MNELPTTATGTLSLLPETKQQVKDFARKVKEEVLSGFADPLEFYIRWKAISAMFELVEKDADIKAAVLKEAEKHGKSFDFHGARVTIKEAGVRYDFSQCGCADWHFHANAVESHKNNLRNVEDFLKHVPETGTADPETGEIVYPPARKSTTIVSIELK